jgi:hypothetical protein
MIFGLLGILIKNRGYLFFSFIGIFIVCLIKRNTFDDLIELIFFSIVLFLYFEISDSTIKFSKLNQDLWPRRDKLDFLLVNQTSGRYLLNLIILIGSTIIATLLIFNARSILSIILPREITHSLEYNSNMFLIVLIVGFIFILIIIKKIYHIYLERSGKTINN